MKQSRVRKMSREGWLKVLQGLNKDWDLAKTIRAMLKLNAE